MCAVVPDSCSSGQSSQVRSLNSLLHHLSKACLRGAYKAEPCPGLNRNQWRRDLKALRDKIPCCPDQTLFNRDNYEGEAKWGRAG